MILSIKDRLVFPAIFAANKDTMTEASLQRYIRALTAITEQETKHISLQPAPNGFIWDATKGIDKEFTLDATQTAYLKETIYTLSRSGGVTQDLLPLCEKIHAL
ncbi:hypothetical protein [Mucilaginibacter sp.]|uniref:hypothetical protein n=1 Tax=Mucilaginibacter sp. TaxID=1882438 RepID=UPI0025E2165F|nr:hypothetical protein [Mucilaginibacter sp.]